LSLKESTCCESIRAWFSQKRKMLVCPNSSHYGDVLAFDPVIRHLFAVEAKIDDARSGIGQALTYLAFADFVYVAVPSGAKERGTLLRKLGLGLLIVEKSGRVRVRCFPSKNKPDSSKLRRKVLSLFLANDNALKRRRKDLQVLATSRVSLLRHLTSAYYHWSRGRHTPWSLSMIHRLELDAFRMQKEIEHAKKFLRYRRVPPLLTGTLQLELNQWFSMWKSWPEITTPKLGLKYRKPRGWGMLWTRIVPEQRLLVYSRHHRNRR